MHDKRRWLPGWQRIELAEKCELEGMSRRQAAAWRRVSPSTVQYWIDRRRAASPAELASGSWAEDRPSTPKRQPRLSSVELHDRVCAARRRTGWGPRLIASELSLPHATVSRCLKRRGLSRPPKPAKEEVRRFEWPCPGDLLQMDTKRFQRFTRPGHAVTGDRFRTGTEKRTRVGHEFVHSIVDDHSRLAYSELHPDQRAATVTGFVERALAFFAAHGIEPKRLQQTTPSPTSTTARCASCSPSEASSTAPSRSAPPSATARWSATSRRSSGNGDSVSATAHHTTAPKRCHTGSTTTTRRGDTQRSGTARPSIAFGTC